MYLFTVALIRMSKVKNMLKYKLHQLVSIYNQLPFSLFPREITLQETAFFLFINACTALNETLFNTFVTASKTIKNILGLAHTKTFSYHFGIVIRPQGNEQLYKNATKAYLCVQGLMNRIA